MRTPPWLVLSLLLSVAPVDAAPPAQKAPARGKAPEKKPASSPASSPGKETAPGQPADGPQGSSGQPPAAADAGSSDSSAADRLKRPDELYRFDVTEQPGARGCVNRPYAMSEFKRFVGQTDAAKQAEVAAAAAALFVQQETAAGSQSKASSVQTPSASCLYERWQQEKADQEQTWFAKKYRLESGYSTALTIYVESEQERANVEAELSPLKEQLRALGKQVAYKKGQLLRAQERLEFSQKNYRTRFASVPWSMVVVGTVPFGPDQKVEELKEQLALHMRQAAGKELIPGRVQGLEQLKGQHIQQFLKETHSSTTAIIDSYDQESQKRIGHQTLVVQLYRIEARPSLLEGSSDTGSQSQPPPKGMMLYAWRKGKLEPLSTAGNAPQGTPSLKLDDAELGYLKDKEDASDNVNDIGGQILRKWEEGFEREQEELKNKRQAIQSDLKKLEDDLQAKNRELQEKEKRLKQLQTASEELKAKSDQARQAYETHYKRRIVQQNRLVSGTAVTRGTPREYIERLAQDTWPSQEQRSGLDSSQILIRQSESDQAGGGDGSVDVQLKMSSIEYRAQVVGFQILYLALYEPDNPPYVLNIAYEIEQTEGPRLNADPQQRMLTIDTTPRQVWTWVTPKVTSLTSSGRQPSGYALPTLEQLRALSTVVQENGPEVLTSLQFDLAYPFVSRDKTRSGKYRTLKVLEGIEGPACDELDEINLLWVPDSAP